MSFLKEEVIFGIIKKPDRPLFLPNTHAVSVIEKLLAGLGWIFEEFINDCKKYPNVNSARNDNEFIIRNTTRTLAYANQVSLLEGILSKSYNEMVDIIKDNIINNFPYEKNPLKILPKISIFRNKVSAHPSYVNPKAPRQEDDNFSTQLSSLSAISSPIFIRNDISSFRLGGVNLIVDNEDSLIPSFGIADAHSLLLVHHKEWGKIFDKVLKEIKNQLPINNGKVEIAVR